jgi:methenyltetrahydromethanopterin cyclohydrolase
MRLNDLAVRRCRLLIEQAEPSSIGVVRSECGTRLVDCGISHPGGIEAGIAVAEVCLAGLGRVALSAPKPDVWPGPAVQI